MTYRYPSDYYTAGVQTAIDHMGRDLVSDGFGGTNPPVVNTGHWQALEGTPHAKTVEMTNVIFEYEIPNTPEQLELEIEPNMPWAEEEFQDRVSGVPHNPHPSVVDWPWYDPNWAASEGGQYSHTYAERYWPKMAWGSGGQAGRKPNRGIRYPYGDLNDVVSLLTRYPGTRQGFAPVWFPEDTGAVHGKRVPCSIGYHFLARAGLLNVNYFIRSCDFLRYFRDDVYLTCRLAQWMVDRIHMKHDVDPGLVVGRLTMFISSLHVFEGDMPKMRKLYASWEG